MQDELGSFLVRGISVAFRRRGLEELFSGAEDVLASFSGAFFEYVPHSLIVFIA